MPYADIFNTDPLAQFAVGGLIVTVLVTIGLFAFVLTRKNNSKSN